MTDSFLNDKMFEIFDSVIKKTHIFDKILELKKLNNGFIFFSTITSTFLILNSLYINYTLNVEYCNLKSKIEEIDIIHNKINDIVEINKGTMLLVKENQNLIQTNFKKVNLYSINSTLSSGSLYNNNNFNSNETINQTYFEENMENKETKKTEEAEKNIKKNNDDDELLSECYDNIPCNNIKKVTGINRFFGW